MENYVGRNKRGGRKRQIVVERRWSTHIRKTHVFSRGTVILNLYDGLGNLNLDPCALGLKLNAQLIDSKLDKVRLDLLSVNSYYNEGKSTYTK